MEDDALDTGLSWSNTSPGLGTGANAPYTKNPLAYNPNITYLPWASANSTDTSVVRLGGANYNNAYNSVEFATSGSRTDLRGSTRTCYVPKTASSDLTDQRQYYRYQIIDSGTKLVRAEWGGTSVGGVNSALGCTGNNTGNKWRDCRDISADGDSDRGVRALAAEKQNYANWYQYHRTRMKAAKAGSSEAFAALDENYRVGLMGLYPTGNSQQVLGGSMNNIIPVETNGGLFVGQSRKDWFDHLHGMEAVRYTPLRTALNAAGQYFTTARAYQSVDANGTTYLACRQNFA